MTGTLVSDLQQLVGAAHVFGPGSDELDSYATRFATHPGVEMRLAAAVRPADAEQLRQSVAHAHGSGLGLLTVYNSSDVGAKLVGAGNTVVLDLSRMDDIHEVDVANGFVRIGPAVSYAQLEAHFAAEGLPLWVDAERDREASVAGSTLAKGIGFTPYGDHALVQCGGEFAMPYGELLRTGMGALPGSNTWQVYKYALGPYGDGLALQSGLMVPTQLGVWVMGQVPAMEVLAFDIEGDAALGAALEVLRNLKIANTLPGTISITQGAFDAARSADDADAPAWRLVSALYGVPKVVELTKLAVDGALGSVPGVVATSPEAATASSSVQERSALVSGKTVATPLVFSQLEQSHHASLSFVAPIEDRFGAAMVRTARMVAETAAVPCLGEFAIVGRALIYTAHIPYHAEDGGQKLADVAMQLVNAMQAEGIGVSSQDFALDHLGLGKSSNAGLANLHDRIERALTA